VLLFARPAAFVLLATTPSDLVAARRRLRRTGRVRSLVALENAACARRTVCAAAGRTRAVRTSDVLSVVYASTSPIRLMKIHHPRAPVRRADCQSQAPHDKAGLVIFGRTPGRISSRHQSALEAGNVIMNSPDRQRGRQTSSRTLSSAPCFLKTIRDALSSSATVCRRGDLSEDRQRPQGPRITGRRAFPFQFSIGDEVWLERPRTSAVRQMGESYEAGISWRRRPPAKEL